ALRGDLSRNALRGLEPGLLRNDARDEPEVARFFGAEHPTAEDHVHRHRLADGTRQTLRASRAGHDSEVDLELPELGGLPRDDQVARHRELAAAAETEARHGRNEWCVQ